ncbi:MAG: hypothetical protein C0602_05910 [Denitrovibrio sp.]|nr:MAG: hypothetical protein C0602_05910 [Denitrovibrio sp.]
MLFEVEKNALKIITENWNVSELDLEKLIVGADNILLNNSIFKEEILIISNQVRTKDKKRADILGLDKDGRGVIIELKKGKGHLGVDMQALQYLADFSRYTGKDFINKFQGKDSKWSSEDIISFLESENLERVNQKNRIILIANSFDSTLFSMGEWLAEKGVPFKCIEYKAIKANDKRLISFTTVFDRTNESLYSIGFTYNDRAPKYFWHNIGRADLDWWKHLIKYSQIPACFENSPGDRGEQILKSYIKDDVIIAYATGIGAIGYGVLEDPKYKLIESKSEENLRKIDSCFHRLSISWKYVVNDFNYGIRPSDLKGYEIYHPVSTSATIANEKAKKLIEDIDNNQFAGFSKQHIALH